MSIARPLGELASALALLAFGALLVPACGSDARATDTCRRIETERCKRAAACGIEDFGDPDSCVRFYDVQCGRGVPDELKEPSKGELDACLKAIQTSCDAVHEPAKVPACSFVTANVAPAPPPDTGTAESATDAADDGG